MRLLKVAAIGAALMLAVAVAAPPMAAFAQDVASSFAIPATAGDTIVTIPAGDWATKVVELAGAILMASAAALVGVAAKMLPDWLRPLVTTAVQAAIANFIRQGIAYSIQWVEGFDKGKVINLNVGSGAVAVAFRYIVEHAPSFLVQLAGGEDKIKDKIIAMLGEFGIVLDAGVYPDQVKASANDNHPALLTAKAA